MKKKSEYGLNNQKRPLTHLDSTHQTLGCRHSNPDICKNHSTPNKCAFVREDGVCLLPPRSWAKIYSSLLKLYEQ